jgi:hypothetical protein
MMVNQLWSLHFEGSKTAEQANNNAVTLIAFFLIHVPEVAIHFSYFREACTI